MVFTKEQINDVKLKAKAATEQLRLEFAPIEERRREKEEAAKKITLPSKEILVGEAISKMPVCSDVQTLVADIIKLLTGLDISIPDPVEEEKEEKITREHIVLSMMVPTKNENHHDYPLDVPTMMLNGIRGEGYDQKNGLQIGGNRGNCLDWVRSGLRPATDVEIDGFFRAWEALSEAGCPLCKGYDMLGIEKKDEDGD